MNARSPFSSRLTTLTLLLFLLLLSPFQLHASSHDTVPGFASTHMAPAGGDACGTDATMIHDIQGNGDASPILDTVVDIEGVVVGDFQNNAEADDGNLSGFYVQEEDAETDGASDTSEGVFVYAPDAADVSAGDQVRVTGTVDEYETSGGASSMTQIADVTAILVCAEGATLPVVTDVTLPVTAISDFEQYEGMLVRFPQELVISEYFNFDRFNEVLLAMPLDGQDRLYQPTAVYEPGSPEAIALAEENARRTITLDDGRTTQNSDPAIHPDGDVFDLTNMFRGGDTLANTTGVIDESFGIYRIQPTAWGTHTTQNPRPTEPEAVGGSLTVTAFNVLNYFTTIDEGQDNCGPSGDMECRGADTPEEFDRQRTKIIAALQQINADIVGLIEIENNEAAAVQDLVDGLNEVMGAGTYAMIDTGTIGTDAIKQALIYKPGTVTPVGDHALLDSTVDARFDDTANRPVLAQTFSEIATDGVLTVAVNHLKSKGSACGEGDDDPVQGNCNVTRTTAAEALVDWLASDPTGSGDPDMLIIGDLNAYDKEDPIDAVREGADDTAGSGDDYTDLIFQYQGEYAYSYLFSGQLGYLDHALAVQSLASQVTGTTVWYINADEVDLIDYDMSFKQDAQDALFEPNAFRSSDHDPVIVGMNLAAPTAVQLSTMTATQSASTMILFPMLGLLAVGAVLLLARRR